MNEVNFCSKCGTKLEGDEAFCPACGNRLAQAAPAPAMRAAVNTTPVQPQVYAEPMQPQTSEDSRIPGYPAPGFSDRIQNPEILAKLNKSKSISRFFLTLLLPIPVIGLPIYALISGDMELKQAFFIGAAISAIILIFNLISKSQSNPKNSYEAEVIDKKVNIRRNKDGQRKVYCTVVRMTDGSKKTIEETNPSSHSAYEYLCVGDRFRFHPQLAFPYEKYDKTADGFVYCACCAKKNNLAEDRCSKCGVPLLK